MMHQAGSEWHFEDGSRLVGVSLKDPAKRRVMQLSAYMKELADASPIKSFQEHAFLLKDGIMKIEPAKSSLKMRSTDPKTMEFLKRIAGSAMFGICPGIAYNKESGEVKAHGICIYTKKEIIVDKSGKHPVSSAKPVSPLAQRGVGS